MVDLREELAGILREFGHPVLLVRTGRRMHCTCWDATRREPDSKCPVCGGTGHVYRLEKHLARQDIGSPVADSRRGALEQLPLGRMESDLNTFYLTHRARPAVGDYLLLVGWRNGRPVNVYHAYEILHVMPRRGRGGRIEFYSVLACTRPAEKGRLAGMLAGWSGG